MLMAQNSPIPDHDSSCSSEDDLSDDEFENDDSAYEELERKKTHPWRLHDELWYNDKGEVSTDHTVTKMSLGREEKTTFFG